MVLSSSLCMCDAHPTSHCVPRVRGAAARPDGYRRAAVACCGRSPRAQLAPRAHPRGGAAPPRRCVLLRAAQRGVFCRARGGRADTAGGGGGARPRTEVRRGAAPPRGAIEDVAPTAAASGGEAAAPLSHALPKRVRRFPTNRPRPPMSPPHVVTHMHHSHSMQCHPMRGCAAGARCFDYAECIWRFRTRRRLCRAPGSRADAGGAGGGAACGRAGCTNFRFPPFVSRVPSSFSRSLSFLSQCLEEVWCCLCFPMASSSERVAARAPRAPHLPLPLPPPEELAAFYALVEKQVAAKVLSRDARCTELSERAARHAQRLWGNSLVVAHLRVSEVISLRELARASTTNSEKEALWRRAWDLLVPVHALLLRRLADNTLLPGTIKEEEVTYAARSQAFYWKAMDKPVPSAADLQGVGAVLGYEALLIAVYITLALLMDLRGSGMPRESAHSIVLTALDAIPRTATMQNRSGSEAGLVAMMDLRMNPQNFEPSFCAAVLRKWRSSAVADVLRARGVLQTGVTASQENLDEFRARQRADIEKIGLRECAWPSCDKVERTVREFKQCSGCRSVWYCSPEHHALDWGAHRKDCQKLDKARRAAMAAGGEASGAAR